MKQNISLSFVIPVYNEKPSLKTLYGEIVAVARPRYSRYEIIFVNDGSTDGTVRFLNALKKTDPKHVKIISFRTRQGKSPALQAGFEEAVGDLVFTLDGDLQDDPREIPKFVQVLRKGADMAVGWKFDRKDGFIKRFTSKIYNAATNSISPAKLHDHNCGFKAFQREVLSEVTLSGNMHRFLTVLLADKGFQIVEIPVNHRKRAFGVSKFGPKRFLDGFVDFLTVFLMVKISPKRIPHFFPEV